jgi:DNA-binding CsgD family transcriptional regulator
MVDSRTAALRFERVPDPPRTRFLPTLRSLVPVEAPSPESSRSDAFARQLRILCLDRAGVDVRFLAGMPALRRKAAELEQVPASERLAVITEFALRPATPVGRGAATRIVVPPAAITGHQLEHLHALRADGARIRVNARATRPMTILNRATALIDLTGVQGAANHESVQINNPDLVRLAVGQFEQLWRSAIPLTGRTPVTLDSFTERQRRVLELLSGGRTDEQVGRELGLSSRSVRTEVAAIRQRLGAQSRFQAGMRYAELQT